jgi:hypothetical protein
MTRRRWDYFVRYLAGAIPPNEYEMKPFSAVTAALRGGPSVGFWTGSESDRERTLNRD